MKIIKTIKLSQFEQKNKWRKVPGSTVIQSSMGELSDKLGDAFIPVQNQILSSLNGIMKEQLDEYYLEVEINFESSGYYEPARITQDPYYSSPAEREDERIVTSVTINAYSPDGEFVGSVDINPVVNSYFQRSFEKDIYSEDIDTENIRPEDY